MRSLFHVCARVTAVRAVLSSGYVHLQHSVQLHEFNFEFATKGKPSAHAQYQSGREQPPGAVHAAMHCTDSGVIIVRWD